MLVKALHAFLECCGRNAMAGQGSDHVFRHFFGTQDTLLHQKRFSCLQERSRNLHIVIGQIQETGIAGLYPVEADMDVFQAPFV